MAELPVTLACGWAVVQLGVGLRTSTVEAVALEIFRCWDGVGSVRVVGL